MAKGRNKQKITMTQAQYRRERKEDAEAIMDTCTMAFLWAAHNAEGWGAKRLTRLLEEVDKVADYISEHRLTTSDIKKALKEETGLEFRSDRK